MLPESWYVYFQLLWIKKKKGRRAVYIGREKKGKENESGQRARNKICRGGWYLGWDGNISRLFSSFLSGTVFLSITLPPRKCLGAGPEVRIEAPGGPLLEPGSAVEGQGLHTVHYLEVSGFLLAAVTAGKWASLQHHYSWKRLKWKCVLASSGASVTLSAVTLYHENYNHTHNIWKHHFLTLDYSTCHQKVLTGLTVVAFIVLFQWK